MNNREREGKKKNRGSLVPATSLQVLDSSSCNEKRWGMRCDAKGKKEKGVGGREGNRGEREDKLDRDSYDAGRKRRGEESMCRGDEVQVHTHAYVRLRGQRCFSRWTLHNHRIFLVNFVHRG